jgi:hypothetical protein
MSVIVNVMADEYQRKKKTKSKRAITLAFTCKLSHFYVVRISDNILKWSLWVRSYVRLLVRLFVHPQLQISQNGYRYFDET